jgi:hypothetical protein
MIHRRLVSMSALAAVMAVVSLASVPAGGQAPAAQSGAAKTWTPPRTQWGEPDLQGVWRYEGVTPMERPKEFGSREFFTDAELAQRLQAEKEMLARKIAGETNGPAVGRRPVEESPIQGNEYNAFWQETFREKIPSKRTSMIVGPDGQIPYTPAARKLDAAQAEIPKGNYPTPFFYQSWLQFNQHERCITDGVQDTLMGGPGGGPNQFMQSPGWVAILQEARNDRRTIPTDGRPHGNIRDWRGDAVGRWEGDTLVVETTNFIDKSHYTWDRVWKRATETLRLVERFTRVDADTIDFQLTLEDPATFTKPWTMTLPLTKLSVPLIEYACHEGNYGVMHGLSQTRNLEKAAAEAAKKGRKR